MKNAVLISLAIGVAGLLVVGALYLRSDDETPAGPLPTAASDSQTSLETQVRVFAPFRGDAVKPELDVTDERRGECSGASTFAPRSDAWRCTSGDEILDPCFSDPDNLQPYVICAETPEELIKLEIGDPSSLPLDQQSFDRPGVDFSTPWAMTLVSGEHCGAIGGATIVVANMRLNYECAQGTLELYGDIDRSGPLWKIFAGRDDSIALEPVGIAETWF